MKIFRFFLLIIFMSFFSTLAFYRTGGFSESKIYSKLHYEPHWKLETPSKATIAEIKNILDQKFYYLDGGRQCFVFVSEDQKYVIKFLNHSRFYVSSIFQWSPFFKKIIHQRIKRRNDRIENFMMSFKIGSENLQEQTKIVFTQLEPYQIFEKSVILLDSSGHVHNIDLNLANFMIQKKADKMIYPYLASLQEESCFEKAVDSVLELISSRIVKGIMDDDLNVGLNIGFDGDCPIMLDTGRLFLDPQMIFFENYEQELIKSSKFLHLWLQKYHPKMSEYFMRKRQSMILSYQQKAA